MIEWNGIKIVETDCMLPIDRVKPYARNAKRHPQEQFDFEENEELFNFYREAFDNLIDKYKTIDYTKPKIIRGNKTWQAVRARQDCASKTAGR